MESSDNQPPRTRYINGFEEMWQKEREKGSLKKEVDLSQYPKEKLQAMVDELVAAMKNMSDILDEDNFQVAFVKDLTDEELELEAWKFLESATSHSLPYGVRVLTSKSNLEIVNSGRPYTSKLAQRAPRPSLPLFPR